MSWTEVFLPRGSTLTPGFSLLPQASVAPVIKAILVWGRIENAMWVVLRGGNFGETQNAGVFATNLDWVTSNQNQNVGFRCASDKKSAR